MSLNYKIHKMEIISFNEKDIFVECGVTHSGDSSFVESVNPTLSDS